MEISGKAVLVTGANRGVGAALVQEFLGRGARTVYAAARDTSKIPDLGTRVVPVQLDVTNREDIANAARVIPELDILVNNAGIMSFASILTASSKELAADMDVNYYGTLSVIQSFIPHLEKSRDSGIVNIISIAGLAPPSGISGYSASKAALFSATQATRAALRAKGISVFGVFPGPIDTDLAKDLPLAKAPVAETAKSIVAGIISGQEDIFPDPTSGQLSNVWNSNPKGLEQFFANM